MNVLGDYLFLSHKEWFMSFAGLDAESLSVYLRIFSGKWGTIRAALNAYQVLKIKYFS